MNFQQSPIKRRVSRQIMVGDVPVGGDAPISVQTMTNTPTSDVKKTVEQIESVERAGADIVRVSVPSLAEAEAFGEIKRRTKIPFRSSKLYISFSTMSVDSPTDRLNKSVYSTIGNLISL